MVSHRESHSKVVHQTACSGYVAEAGYHCTSLNWHSSIEEAAKQIGTRTRRETLSLLQFCFSALYWQSLILRSLRRKKMFMGSNSTIAEQVIKGGIATQRPWINNWSSTQQKRNLSPTKSHTSTWFFWFFWTYLHSLFQPTCCNGYLGSWKGTSYPYLYLRELGVFR